MGIDPDKVPVNIDRCGNTTAGTIPLAMRDAVDKGLLKKGSLALLCAVGAGFTVGTALVLLTMNQEPVRELGGAAFRAPPGQMQGGATQAM